MCNSINSICIGRNTVGHEQLGIDSHLCADTSPIVVSQTIIKGTLAVSEISKYKVDNTIEESWERVHLLSQIHHVWVNLAVSVKVSCNCHIVHNFLPHSNIVTSSGSCYSCWNLCDSKGVFIEICVLVDCLEQLDHWLVALVSCVRGIVL